MPLIHFFIIYFMIMLMMIIIIIIVVAFLFYYVTIPVTNFPKLICNCKAGAARFP